MWPLPFDVSWFADGGVVVEFPLALPQRRRRGGEREAGGTVEDHGGGGVEGFPERVHLVGGGYPALLALLPKLFWRHATARCRPAKTAVRRWRTRHVQIRIIAGQTEL